MLFDTHTHLNDAKFDADRDDVLRLCGEAGVTRIIEIADSPAEWARALALSRARPFVRCSLGLHPYHAAEWTAALAEELPKKAPLPEVVAVGEIGLDYAKAQIPADVQKSSFRSMLGVAWACGLPVVIHCRDAFADLLPLLEEFYQGKAPQGRFHGVLHCFSGGAEEAKRSLALGFALGVDGPITYPKNGALRDAVKSAGLENLVLETDSPYLPPQSSRGKRNDPRSLPEIAAALAQVFAVTTETVAAATFRNSLALFRLDENGNKRR